MTCHASKSNAASSRELPSIGKNFRTLGVDKAARQARSRLRLRPCKWSECGVVVDSEEKLLEHLKDVHVEKAKAEKGQMVSFTVSLPVQVSFALATNSVALGGMVVDFTLVLTGLRV